MNELLNKQHKPVMKKYQLSLLSISTIFIYAVIAFMVCKNYNRVIQPIESAAPSPADNPWKLFSDYDYQSNNFSMGITEENGTGCCNLDVQCPVYTIQRIKQLLPGHLHAG